MEMIINHMNRSLNIIKHRDKCSKGTRRQAVEKSVKAKLPQTSKAWSINSHMAGHTTTLTVSPWKNVFTMANSWYSKHCSFNQSDNKLLLPWCRAQCLQNLLPAFHKSEFSTHRAHKIENHPFTQSRDGQVQEEGRKAKFFPQSVASHEIPAHKLHILLSCPSLPSPSFWFAKQRGTDDPSVVVPYR